MTELQYERDNDGIVTLTFNASGKSANTMTDAWLAEMNAAVTQLKSEDDLRGVVLASAKSTFFAGGDLELLLAEQRTADELFEYVEANKAPLRALERLPVPVVAAINGAALGGGYELCLAANYRILVDDAKAVVGLPEVTLGLMPGAGGVVRLVKLIGLKAALPLLMEGRPLAPQDALAAGLVDEIASNASEVVSSAKAWIKANPRRSTQLWDEKPFHHPGGDADDQAVRMIASIEPTSLFARTRGLLPAPEKILDIAVNSMRMGYDSALRSESRGIVSLIPTMQCKAAIATFFFGVKAMKSGKGRPVGAPWQAKQCGVIGAGMLGASIALANEACGLPTFLKDTVRSSTDKENTASETLAAKNFTPETIGEDAAAGIEPLEDGGSLVGSDLIIEAVCEDIVLKERVIRGAFPHLVNDGIYASNTSTMPISILAEACPEPSRFVGLNFFSPVEQMFCPVKRMKIVEIIVGQKTSATTVAKAYDYARQIGYTPIVVNDARGFFTSRVFGTYLDEGCALLRDGMNPAAIERAGWRAGMPMGPLAIHDEVSIARTKRVREINTALDARLGIEHGFPAEDVSSATISERMLALGRGGRAYDGGFYDYSEDGTKQLWSGLADFRERSLDISIDDAIDRLLYRQAIEALRCFSEGVLNTEMECNLGSIMAIGFPVHTGGALQFIRGIGRLAFTDRAGILADRYGERFRVTEATFAPLADAIEAGAA